VTQFAFSTIRSRIVFSSYDFYLQAIFASSIPEIIELVGSRSKYSGEYKREHGKRYYYQIYVLQTLCLLSINFAFPLPVCLCIYLYLLVRINEFTFTIYTKSRTYTHINAHDVQFARVHLYTRLPSR